MNHLSQEKSPYLLQHVHNPVDWYPWGEEAFQKALKEDKLIFLSIGYSTCHWCHVMAHESFEDEEVAETLNRDFVCIKVDREERPEIDAVYMAVCQAATGSGGWPLTVFLTPDQKPVFTGTYFPKQPRYGHPGLLTLLQELSGLWRTKRQELMSTGEQLKELVLRQNSVSDSGQLPGMEPVHEAVSLLRRGFDRKWGGFFSAPKFPSPHTLLFLLRYAGLEKDPYALEMAEKTLDGMAAGGLMDQIGGGFSRYSTDEAWLIPHFEKMLYDNALLSYVYLEAYAATGKSKYAQTAVRTLNFILKELTGPEGEFYCALDADSEDGEGTYYLFTPQEVFKVLGEEDGREFCRIYGITKKGNFEGKSVPNLLENAGQPWEPSDPRLAKLYAYREQRTKLHRDDKVITSWNSWTILAFAKAAQVLKDDCPEKYLQAARRACQFLNRHVTTENGMLYLRWRKGEAFNAGQLDDYAVWGLAMLELYRATADPGYLTDAVKKAQQMTDYFEDEEHGGYYMTAKDTKELLFRPKESYDGAIPSGNSAAAALLIQLAALTGEQKFRAASDRQLSFVANAARDYPTGMSFGLTAILQSLHAQSLLICVSAGDGIPAEMRGCLREPSLLILWKNNRNRAELEQAVPMLADYPIPEEGTVYYLCRNGRCMAPVKEFSKLQGYLEEIN